MNDVGESARWAAAQRAMESRREDRLFDDPYAEALAGEDGMERLRRWNEVDPMREFTAAFVALRGRFIDDRLREALAEGTRQIVLLGAGMDARAFRLDLPEDAVVYELDQFDVLEAKRTILDRLNAAPKASRRIVPVDLLDDWIHPLLEAGFQPDRRSFFILEGFLHYLEESAALRLLDRVSEIACAASSLCADTVSVSFYRNPMTQAALRRMESFGMVWRFGCDDPEALFAERGWEAAVLQPGDEGANYGRWRLKAPPRSEREIPRSFLIKADKLAD